MRYIDVSEWQGDIDYDKLHGAVDGIIIRAGYGKGKKDKKFERNAQMCNLYGIPCGAYWFSYAKSVDDAKLEAAYLLDAVKPYKMELPLAFDFEYDSVTNAEKSGVTVDKRLVSNMVRAFCDAIEAAGYWAINYANPDFLNRYLDPMIPERYGLWLASWPKMVDVTKPPRKCAIWQWGGSCVPGISGNVDTNESYTDFVRVIRENGLNNLNYTQSKPKDEKADAVAWAMENGISGSEEIALALWQYHKAFGK
jgi:GH25 family lysozyme M1 (1,4-beta-N-acetylmuramidase)